MQEPRPTCPKIDQVKVDLRLDLEVIQEKLSTLQDDIDDGYELVRDDNKSLRKYIEHQSMIIEAQEAKIEEQNNKIYKLEEKIEVMEEYL